MSKSLRINARVEIAPHYDLWMQGAKYGQIKDFDGEGNAWVKMDHPAVRKLVKIPNKDLKVLD